MAIRIDGNEAIQTFSNLPASTLFTSCCWAMRVADRNTFTTMISLDTTSDIITIQTAADGDSVTVATLFDVSPTLITISNNAWFFSAMTCAGTGATDLKGYAALATDATITSASIPGVSFTPTALVYGNNAFSEWFNGRIAAVKVWDAVLSSAEIEAERWSFAPARRANLHSWVPMIDPTVLLSETDYSGNGNNMGDSTTAVMTIEDGPPIAWAPGRKFRKTFPAEVVVEDPSILLLAGVTSPG